jgi:diaminopimelate epimerase
MSGIPFVKVESIGNDFVLTHSDAVAEDDLREFAKAVCERRFGVGSDGLLVIAPRSTDSILLRMFNPDGTEDFCGNGLRCAAAYAHSMHWVDSAFRIEHLGRVVQAVMRPDGAIRTDIGTASFDPRRVPLDECSGELFMSTLELEDATLTVSAVTTGSTHTVILCDQLPRDREFFRMSRELEIHPLFPERTSVIWAQPLTEDEMRIRIWERGAGETMGCGTGSSAAAVVVMRARNRGGRIAVHNPGGSVVVEASAWDQPISISGRAEILYSGNFCWNRAGGRRQQAK